MLSREPVRGRVLLTPKEYRQRARLLREDSVLKPLPRFGGITLPYAAAVENFLFMGVQGAGKTTLIDDLMQSVLTGYVGKAGHRAVVYDHSGESVSLMEGLGFSLREGSLKLLNPFDKRGVVWDIAKDITSSALARQFARIMIPENPNLTEPFWEDKARRLLEGILIAFITKSPGDWSLRDVVEVGYFADNSTLCHVLSWNPENAPLIRELNGRADKMVDSIKAVLEKKLGDYIEIAALWSQPRESITVSSFLKESYVLLLGSHPTLRHSISTINQLFLTCLFDQILTSDRNANDNANPQRTWFFCDEGADVGKVEGLLDFLNLARKYGCSSVFSFHDFEQIEEIYDKRAHSFLAKFGNRCFLRLEDEKSMNMASNYFGESEFVESSSSQSEGDSFVSLNGEQVGYTANRSFGSSNSQALCPTKLVLPNEFGSLPRIWEAGEVTGFFSSCVGASKYTIPKEYLEKRRIKRAENVRDKDFFDLSTIKFPFSSSQAIAAVTNGEVH